MWLWKRKFLKDPTPFLPSLIEFGLLVLEKKIFKKFSVFSLF
jgi:hypothetical protein